jgi:tyrosinase
VPFWLELESDPHDNAHTSFTGDISRLRTAAQDPLFYLLHANVDRLWAVFQWLHQRADPSQDASYPSGSSVLDGTDRVGHRLADTMWPWNGITGGLRPPDAPGGDFPASSLVAAPGLQPTVGSTIDYQGLGDPTTRLGYDYDDVPFRTP